jgi:hypothetical protein
MNAYILMITYNMHNICNTYFTYSSTFENCFICIIMYIYIISLSVVNHFNVIKKQRNFYQSQTAKIKPYIIEVVDGSK